MLAHRPIRHKLIFMLFLLVIFVAAGFLASLTGVYLYRNTVKSVSMRAKELPYATSLMRWVGDLRVVVKEIESIEDYGQHHDQSWLETEILRRQFVASLTNFRNNLQAYRSPNEGKHPSQ